MNANMLAPLPPCPTGKRGRHDVFVDPSLGESGVLIQMCGLCGMARTFAVTADPLGGLDATLAVAEIERRLNGRDA